MEDDVVGLHGISTREEKVADGALQEQVVEAVGDEEEVVRWRKMVSAQVR